MIYKKMENVLSKFQVASYHEDANIWIFEYINSCIINLYNQDFIPSTSNIYCGLRTHHKFILILTLDSLI